MVDVGSAPPVVTASILIAAHNAAAFLDGAVSSALSQTCRTVEVVAVDDASSDGTHDLLAAWARRDRRLTVLRHPQRRGAGAARNTAIAHARGRWLAVLDADDAFLPERMERLVPLAEETGADLLADNLVERDFDTGARLGTALPPADMASAGPINLAAMLRRDRVDLPGRSKIGYLKPIMRRDFLERSGVRYRPEIQVGEDLLFYFECVRAGARFRLAADQALYLYSVRGGSASNQGAGALHLSAATRRMRKLARGLADAELDALLRQRQRAADSDCFDLAIEARRPREALRYARWADPARVARRLGMAANALSRRLVGGAPARDGRL
ncbi:glycosyltransferase family 2 protein [Craurococcus roseus]|uniref:Glycosyltransferase family 2 protein n=1 Tax=Craurococcus roseus TaxID=77585 RepID=A0ABP3Q5V8_9PROT